MPRSEADNESAIEDPRVQHQSYTFEETGEEIPYALFVPSDYDASTPAPLIVSLHGLGRQYDWVMGYERYLDLAEAGGYIVITPLGYVRRGWYGSRPLRDEAGALLPDGPRSEQDVMNVLALVRNAYSVDSNQIYLWGHSMGGAGTYHLAAKYPNVWAGLGVAAPAPLPTTDAAATLMRFRDVPIIVLQGTEDGLIASTRTWVAHMKQLGMPHVYVEVQGGDHSLFMREGPENMAKVVSFFDITRRDYGWQAPKADSKRGT